MPKPLKLAPFGTRGLIGCLFMLAGMLLSELWPFLAPPREPTPNLNKIPGEFCRGT